MNKMRGVVALVLSLLALCGVCFGAGYNVGDGPGWNLGVDYKHWASSKSFHVGDTLVFRYNIAMHNVKQVTKKDYKSCNANNPIATFSSALDTITIQEKKTLYFICGIPDHCQAGMRVKIKVSGGGGGYSSSPKTPGADCTPAGGGSPPKSDSAATSINCFQLWAALILSCIGFHLF